MSDAQRFAELYRREEPNVFRFVLRRLAPGNTAYAEDITQETFLTVWKDFSNYPEDPGESRGLLFGIARNHLLHNARSRGRQGMLAVRIAHQPQADVAMPDDYVQPRLDLINAWNQLSPADQEVIALTTWDGLSSVAAGRALGISDSAYRMRLQRARQHLRMALPGTNPLDT